MEKVMAVIREEQRGDIAAVREVNDRAFGQTQEGEIIEQLRAGCKELVSLVATEGEKIVGHILFSPAIIESDGEEVNGMGLAPMAVLPEYQRKGIGSMLVQKGIEKIKQMGYPFIIVLGHAEYYRRFGFEQASIYGIKSQWDVPDEAFMVMILDGATMSGVSGTGRYREEFNQAM
jgi:putative acetyltransferase